MKSHTLNDLGLSKWILIFPLAIAAAGCSSPDDPTPAGSPSQTVEDVARDRDSAEVPVENAPPPIPQPPNADLPWFPGDPDAPQIPIPPGGEPNDPEPPNPPKNYIKKEQIVKVTAQSETDILFVVDNSGSMREEQVGLADKIDGFMTLIQKLDWQIGLTTTDPRLNTRDANNISRPWGDGQLRPFDRINGSQFVMRSNEESLESAQSKLAEAIQVGIRGSGDERGINAVYRALERSLSSQGPHRQLFRLESKLAVVLISDEDECSIGNCLSNSPKSVPENIIQLVQETFGEQKVFQFHSIIFKPGDASCTTGFNQGHTYAHLTVLTGGILGSVCDDDYTEILQQMGERTVELVNSTNLSCAAADTNLDGKPNVRIVLSDGSVIAEGLRIEGTTLLFGQGLPEGEHRVEYFCEP